MIDFAKLVPYRKNVRPAAATSQPAFLDQEFARVAGVTQGIVEALRDLDARLKALEP